MQTTEMNGRASLSRRSILIGSGVLLAIVVLVGVWFGMRHTGGTKPAPPNSSPSPSAVASPASASSDVATAGATDLQIDLAMEDLKKAQIRTARVTRGATATTL